MFCPHCGTEIGDKRFCHNCGVQAVILCSCGQDNMHGIKFCTKCGTAVAGKPVPQAPSPAVKPGGILKKALEARECKRNGHEWNGCKCVICGTKRNAGHKFQAVLGSGQCERECTICGKIEKKHLFEPVPGVCELRCVNCGRTKEKKHEFQLVPGRCLKQCSVCGMIQEIPHEYGDGRKCIRCDKRKPFFD